MRKKGLWIMALIIAATLVVQPFESHALSELEKIEQKIRELQKQMAKAEKDKKAAENTKKNLEKEIKELEARKRTTKEEINALLAQIDEVNAQIMETEQQITETEEKLRQIGEELEATIRRKEKQDELLQTRIRLLYMDGAVSYLDVLMQSTSFADFLERFDVIRSLVVEDRNILDRVRDYEQLVREKQAQRDAELVALKALYDERLARLAELEEKEREKEVMIASYNQQIAKNEDAIEEYEEISEEAEQLLWKLAQEVSKLEAQKKTYKNYYTGGKLGVPLKDPYTITSKYGNRVHPIYKTKRLHAGIDMAAPQGTPVYAAESGVVTVAQSWSGYGNCIIIDHGGGLMTLYGHLKPGGILVEKGQEVKKGEKIGLVGMTGTATGYHLHFEVRLNGEPVDPEPYLK
jgi:murein DD-endopeptidase MepM/ murein hydrolase activator NlpD